MITALELQRDIHVHRSSISRALSRRGFTQKKPTVVASERDNARRAAWHNNFVLRYEARQIVAVDESGCNRNTGKPKLAWAPTGDRARRRDVFVRGIRYSVLPATSLDGVLHVDVIDQAWNADCFYDFVDGLLDKMGDFPDDNSVILLDNASIHHSEDLQILIESRGKRLEYLPPYSPDFNPIEEGFSAMKAWLGRNRDYMLGELEGGEACDPKQLLMTAVFETMTPDNVLGWFHPSRYI